MKTRTLCTVILQEILTMKEIETLFLIKKTLERLYFDGCDSLTELTKSILFLQDYCSSAATTNSTQQKVLNLAITAGNTLCA